MHIVGTAGHVDHGKSSLVRALTGTNPDRLAEEQRRGMTLDLGFAHLVYPDGTEAGIVDVPGHERFLRTMVAGAAGMEIVILVVSANEGPKAQTLEHLAILQYLNVQRVIVVLSKSDLVNDEERTFAIELLHEALIGTIAEGAAVIAASTVSGNGIEALRAAIHAALVTLPPRGPNAPVYLPVDRVFAVAGHGTVITGSLMQGSISIGDTLKVTPLGRTVRVRGLHVFGESRDAVAGGARVAANLVGVDTSEIARGAVLSGQEVEATARFDVRFRPLPASRALLKHRTPVRAYIGSAEIIGTLILGDALDTGPDVPARLVLRSPTIVIPGAAFVLRSLSPMRVLGGGTIAAHDAAQRPAGEDENGEVAAILDAVRESGLTGATAATAGATANVREERTREVLEGLFLRGRVLKLNKPFTFVDAGVAEAIVAQTIDILERYHHERPWALGLPSASLARAIEMTESSVTRVLAPFVTDGTLAHRGGSYATPEFAPRVTAAQRAFFDAAWPSELVPAVFPELIARIVAAKRDDLSSAFETLFSVGTLVRVGDFVYHDSQLAVIRGSLERALTGGRAITVAEFRTLTGTSRKYAVPLLEHFDASGVTRRIGDVRVLRH